MTYKPTPDELHAAALAIGRHIRARLILRRLLPVVTPRWPQRDRYDCVHVRWWHRLRWRRWREWRRIVAEHGEPHGIRLRVCL